MINYNNQTVIAKVNISKNNMKSLRGVKRRLKSVKNLGSSGVIALDYIQTVKNLVDPFTKGLSCNVIGNSSRKMKIRPTSSRPQ